ncbi:MAG: bifunctional (p)ppGpp synthetase/guanosine-3',5'-bis(diphosphate) 3'-pyrophosphohydrolase [Pseudomonadales bacterium]
MRGSATSDGPGLTQPPPAPKHSGSYFVTRLAERARTEAVAAPVTFEALRDNQLVNYLDAAQINEVEAAYRYAEKAHAGQRRRTGHAYITHPLAVSEILASMRMDHQSLMAALLHDVIEDTKIDKATIASLFGQPVAELVDGVSKLSKIFKTRLEAQAENFQKMALAMAKDIRVIMVKMADRLHNMRTIGVMSDEQRKRVARETLDFYAPIANRLGIHHMKLEFEDLGFQALYPLRADRISRAVNAARGHRKELTEEVRTSIARALMQEGIQATVQSREKHIYSIYRKMRSQHKSFRKLTDVFGYRIIVSQVDECYRALGVVHNLYKPMAGRFKDYIAIPKSNGYQSLHTTLFSMHGLPIEVQIRTKHMQSVAQHGIAGHWLYKASESDNFDASQRRAREWVRDLLELQQRAGNPIEFIESLKIDLFPDEVYVFTPRGEIMELPRGACAVDFAYAVHTDIGNTCNSCLVDGNPAPLSQQLQSGQFVEIRTSPGARPNAEWLTFVVTGKARSAIRHSLKHQQLSESIALGERLLNRSLAGGNRNIHDFDFRRLRKVLKEFGARRLNDLLAAIGNGDQMAYVVAQRLISADDPSREAVFVEQEGPVNIRGGEGLVIKYARCCGPVPGDPIVGHMTPGKGFVVHVETCANISEIRRRKASEIIPARWAGTTKGEFETALRIDVTRQKGVIAELAATLTDTDANIENITVDERSANVTSVVVVIGVRDRTHLARVMRRIRAITATLSITRTSP